ncbi:hypothetical protein DL95DRAFT_395576 [Leptodontidium sp. 2 PMI_412]|nr:hypothetical protein DL95DRAFT_395576 [Leptodontidium sp. 2 PMI_412]
MACYYGHKEIVEYLLNQGADLAFVSPSDIFAVTIFHSSRHPSTCCRQHICPDGCISDVTETAGGIVVPEWRYPIAAAMEQGHEDIVALLSSSAASDNSNSTSSHHSSDTGHRDWPPLSSTPLYCKMLFLSYHSPRIIANNCSVTLDDQCQPGSLDDLLTFEVMEVRLYGSWTLWKLWLTPREPTNCVLSWHSSTP